MIEQAIQRLAPGYVLTDAQRDQIARNDDQAEAAARLPGAVESIARCIADKADDPFDWRLIPVEWLIPLIDLPRVSKGYHYSFAYTAQKIDENRLIELGRIVERAAKPAGFFERLYLRHIGKIDPVGLAWWETQAEKWFVEAAERDGTIE